MVRFSTGGRPSTPIKPTSVSAHPLDPTYEPVLGPILSVKMYGRQDRLLAMLLEVLSPRLDQLEARGMLAKWFFVRYADGDTHFRLRLFAGNAEGSQEVLQRVGTLLDRMMRDGQIDRWTIEPYRREWARFGGKAAMPCVEKLFSFDSKQAITTIKALAAEGRYTADTARPAAVALTLGWYRAVAMTRTQSQDLIRHMCQRLRTSTGAERGAYREDVSAAIAAIKEGSSYPAPMIHAQSAQRLTQLGQSPHFSTTLENVTTSLINMSLNRLMPHWSREEEHRIYLAAQTCLHAYPEIWNQVALQDEQTPRALAG